MRASSIPIITPQEAGRFWAKVDIRRPDECWPWIASKATNGYGQFAVRGKLYRAHRLAFALIRGPVPTNVKLCHICDNRACVNPVHVWFGTQLDNIRDAARKGRMPGGKIRGERNPKAKLTTEAVRMIRALYGRGWTYATLGTRFGVSPQAVRHIIKRRTWNHIAAPMEKEEHP